MTRFIVVEQDVAYKAPNAAAYGLDIEDPDPSWYAYGSYLIDTSTGNIVFSDLMEPEDACLDRDLRPLVTLLNELSG